MANVNVYPFNVIDWAILLFFWIDYIIRLYLSKSKFKFFKENLFDLLAIIPFDSIFSIFRAFRVLRILRLLRIIRIVGFVGKIQKNITRFFKTNGFIYMLYTSIVLILLSAEIYSVAENSNYSDSLWWAIATTTTVGYGDISPDTEVGRIVAVMLMILGIGLIGSITSTVTAFFVNKKEEQQTIDLEIEVSKLHLEIKELKEIITKKDLT